MLILHKYIKKFAVLFVSINIESYDLHALNYKSEVLEKKLADAIKLIEEKDYYEAAKDLIALKKLSVNAAIYKHVLIQLGRAYYMDDNYQKAAIVFRDFYNIYSELPEAEQTLYIRCCCHHKLSENPKIDQTNTVEGKNCCDLYMDLFPNGKFYEKIKKLNEDFIYKLATKEKNKVKIFFDLKIYKSAYVA